MALVVTSDSIKHISSAGRKSDRGQTQDHKFRLPRPELRGQASTFAMRHSFTRISLVYGRQLEPDTGASTPSRPRFLCFLTLDSLEPHKLQPSSTLHRKWLRRGSQRVRRVARSFEGLGLPSLPTCADLWQGLAYTEHDSDSYSTTPGVKVPRLY